MLTGVEFVKFHELTSTPLILTTMFAISLSESSSVIVHDWSGSPFLVNSQVEPASNVFWSSASTFDHAMEVPALTLTMAPLYSCLAVSSVISAPVALYTLSMVETVSVLSCVTMR